MDSIRPYASFLLQSHLDKLTIENIKLAKKYEIPLLKLLADLDDEQLYTAFRQGLEVFLGHLAQGTALQYSREMIHQWDANEIPYIRRNQLGMEDLTLLYSIRKQLLVAFLPAYSADVTVHNSIVLALEDFYRTLQGDALQVYFKIEKEQLIDQNAQLQQRLNQLGETQLALKESQAMAHLGNWVLNVDKNNYVYGSDELYSIYGLAPNQTLSLAMLDQFIHTDDFLFLQEHNQRAIMQGTPYACEYRIIRTDGQVRTLFTKGQPMLDEQGKVVRIIGIAQDITDRKAIEDALRLQKLELNQLNADLMSNQEQLQTIYDELQESHEEIQTVNEELREQIELRLAVEVSLDRERGFLKAVLDHISDGIVACDEQGTLAFFNQATRKFHGIPEQALVAEQWADYYSLYKADGLTLMKKEDVPLFKAFQGEPVQDLEMVIAPLKGLKRTLLATGNQIVSKEGQLLGAVVVMHDITRQKENQRELMELNFQLTESNEELVRTEELLTELNGELEERVTVRTAELERSNQQFQFLADSVPLIIWTANNEGNATYFNQVWYKYTGLSKEESMLWAWQRVLHPDDLELCTQRWLYSVQTGEDYQIEYRMKGGIEGNYRWHLGRGLAMKDESGLITQWFGSCVDIHDQKMIEVELREKNRTFELLNQVNMSLSAELELEKIVQTVTDVTTELTGAQFGAFFYNVINERNETLTLYTISGAPIEAFAAFGHPRNTAVFAPTFHGEGVIRSDDITQDPRYGHNEPHHGLPKGHLPVRSYMAVPVISRSGEVIGGLFFGHAQPEVFKQKSEELVIGIASQTAIAIDNSRLFDKLKDKNSELARINTELDSFIYTASHDLKAPIMNIQGLFSILSQKMNNQMEERDKNLFNMINLSIAKFNRTIQDLTEITAIQKNLEGKSTVLFSDLYEDIREDLQQMLTDAGGIFQTDFQVDSLFIEKKHLRSIFYNLLTNAIKYRSPARPLVVNIDTFLSNNRPTLRVSDNGLGIRASQQSKLFMIFKRLHTHVEGSGVGLYMIKRIIENNGGSIEVTSEEGRGTAFTIIF